jgi:hypothetical protein
MEIKKGFPDYYTYFVGIICDHNQNIYVFLTGTDPGQLNRRKLDIFSPGGKYLYSAEIVVEEGLEIRGSHWKKDKLYLAVETEDGDIKLVKYKIRLLNPMAEETKGVSICWVVSAERILLDLGWGVRKAPCSMRLPPGRLRKSEMKILVRTVITNRLYWG